MNFQKQYQNSKENYFIAILNCIPNKYLMNIAQITPFINLTFLF